MLNEIKEFNRMYSELETYYHNLTKKLSMTFDYDNIFRGVVYIVSELEIKSKVVETVAEFEDCKVILAFGDDGEYSQSHLYVIQQHEKVVMNLLINKIVESPLKNKIQLCYNMHGVKEFDTGNIITTFSNAYDIKFMQEEDELCIVMNRKKD